MYANKEAFIKLIKDLPNNVMIRVEQFKYDGESKKGYYISCVTDIYDVALENK